LPHDATAPLQSPIDLTHAVPVPGLRPLDFRYRAGDIVQSVTLSIHNGACQQGRLQAVPILAVTLRPNAGLLRVGADAYRLRSLHWHTPADHALDGRRPGMEMHLVHTHEQTGALLVVGVHYREQPYPSTTAPLLPIFSRFAELKSAATFPPPQLDLPELLPHAPRRYTSYRYDGSLTTADDDGVFREGVQWIVLRDQAPVSVALIHAHRALVDADLRDLHFDGRETFDFQRPRPQGNARALQDRAGRTIETEA